VKKQLLLILVYVFIDVLGFSLILPLLPFYAATFDATPAVVGLLLGVNALTQLISAPVIGRLSDRYGRRPLLLVSIAGTVASFAMLGLARSLWMLFASRMLDGLLGGNISLAQAYISDVTDERDRARGLGLIGAAFGVGFIFGPAIGGTLSAGGNYALPAWIAAGLSLVNLLGVLAWLPESLPADRRQGKARNPAARVSARALWEALQRPCVGPLLSLQLFFGLAFTMFQTIFALFAQERLGLGAQSTSYVLTYVGLLVVIVQGGGIGFLSKRFGDRQLILAGTVVMTFALLAWAFTPNVWLLLVVLAPLALAGGVLNVVSSSALTKSVYPQEIGGTLGLSAALGSLARVISPILGGFLIDGLGPAAPGILGALIMAWLVVFAWRRILPAAATSCPAPARQASPSSFSSKE
jgi:DHA1 family tetracycline resistance protein-like MFS transporter